MVSSDEASAEKRVADSHDGIKSRRGMERGYDAFGVHGIDVAHANFFVKI